MLLILETSGNLGEGIPLGKNDGKNKICFFISCDLQWVRVINQRHKRYSIMSNFASFPNRSLPFSSEFRQVYGLIWCLVSGSFEVLGEVVNPCSSCKRGWNCRVILHHSGPVFVHSHSSQPSLLLHVPLCQWGQPGVNSFVETVPPLRLLRSLFWATCFLRPPLDLASRLSDST